MPQTIPLIFLLYDDGNALLLDQNFAV